MKSKTEVLIRRAGSYDRLELVESELEEPGFGEVQIEVHATGVNYADVIVRMGLYASAKEFVGWPITPGFEVAGVVRRVGSDVKEFQPGDRVVAVTLFGGYASAINLAAEQVLKLPDGLSFVQAAALPAVFVTAHFALHSLAHPRPGERMLVHSAAGGVGGCLVQLGKRIGCEVTGVVGRTSKVETARAFGCDHVIDKSTENLWRRAERIAPKGFDHVLDANGVATLGESYRHLASPGKLVVYGFATMLPKDGARTNYLKLAADYLRTPRFNPLDMTNASKSVLAFNLSYLFDRLDLLHEAMADVLRWLEDGSIVAPPTTTYALRAVADAHRDIESGKTVGKLILVPEHSA